MQPLVQLERKQLNNFKALVFLLVFHCTIKLALLLLLALDMVANTWNRLTIETAPAGDHRLSKQISSQEPDFLLCG